MKCRYLKWRNDTIGLIDEQCNVTFSRPEYNEVVALYTNGEGVWSRQQLVDFLSERIVSRDRRDIERILFRCGLSIYDVLKIGEITRGIHPKDLIWMAETEEETLDGVVTDVFESVFIRNTDLEGDSIDTPEGYNIKMMLLDFITRQDDRHLSNMAIKVSRDKDYRLDGAKRWIRKSIDIVKNM